MKQKIAHAATAVLLIVGIAGACSRAEGPAQATRDSAGIRIIELSVSSASELSVSASPTLDLTSTDDPAGQFYRVSDAAFFPDGSIAVANSGTNQIRIFNPDGMPISEFGRRGDGPGEFQSLRRLFLLSSDRLMIPDRRQRRISMLDGSGSLIDDAPMPTTIGRADVVGHLAGDTVVTAHYVTTPSPTEFLPQFKQYTLYTLSTGETHAFTRVSSGTIGFIGGMEPWGAVDGAMFGPQAHAVTVDGQLVVADGANPELRGFDRGERLSWILRWDRPIQRVTDAEVETYRAAFIAEMETAIEREMLGKQLDAQPIAEHFPSLEELRVDGDGRIWVKEYVQPSHESELWYAFDLVEATVSSLSLPKGKRWLNASGDLLLLLERDALDVEHVCAYRMTAVE